MSASEVESLVKLERFLRDTNQWTRWRTCYHPDSSKTNINISWFSGEIDDFVQQSQRVAATGVQPQHLVVPVDVRIVGGRAIATSTCVISNRFQYREASYDLVANLLLLSRLVMIDGEWKLLSLEGIYQRDAIVPVFPTLVTADMFDMTGIKDVRESYRCLIWNIERQGRQASRDLPGIDRPATVTAIIEKLEKWIGEAD